MEEIIGQNQGRFIKLAEQKIDLVGVLGGGGGLIVTGVKAAARPQEHLC